MQRRFMLRLRPNEAEQRPGRSASLAAAARPLQRNRLPVLGESRVRLFQVESSQLVSSLHRIAKLTFSFQTDPEIDRSVNTSTNTVFPFHRWSGTIWQFPI